MEAFFAFLGALLALVLLISIVIGVVFPLLSPERSATDELPQRLLAWVALAIWSIPTTIGTALGGVFGHIQSYWKFYVIALIALTFSFGWMAQQTTVLKVYDAYETEIVYPFNNDVLLPILNVFRLFYSGTICWVNIAAGFGRYVRWALLVVAEDCPEYTSNATIAAAASIPILPIFSLRDFVLSGFSSNVAVSPTMNAVADTFTTFEPMFKCQCEAIYPVWPMLLDADYGIFQSPRLHGIPDVALNLYLDLFQTHVSAVIDIAEQVGGICSTVNDTRECLVTRGPNYDRTADLTCELATHTFDLLDDSVNAVLSGLEEAPWNVVMPWPKNPRIFGLLAMPLCVLTDNIYLGMDALTHADLFFTLSGDNYAREILYERPISRLYNMSTQIQAIGDDLGTDTTSDIACIIAKIWNLTVGLFDITFGIIREILAVNFDGASIKNYLKGGIIQSKLTIMKTDGETLGGCVERTGDRLGHGLQTVFQGIQKFGNTIITLATNIAANADDIIPYFQSVGFENTVDEMFTSLNLVAGGIGGTVRQLGAFGSVECSIRNLTASPDDISTIQIGDTHLNVMCAMGNTSEMLVRWVGAVLKYFLGIMIRFFQILAGGAAPALSTLANEFKAGGSLDLAQADGVIEHTCLLVDSGTMFIPSLLNLADDPILCPESAVPVANVVWNVFRSFLRLFLIPWNVINIYIRAIGVFADAPSSYTTFGNACPELLVPYWSSIVSPMVEVGLAGSDIASCIIPGFDDPGGTFHEINLAVGKAFIDTSYSGSDVVDCGQITSADGGEIVSFLCDFLEDLQFLIDFIISIFSEGFWQALWNLIVPPLEALFDEVIDLIVCIWNNVLALFDKLGQCGGALVSVDVFFDIEQGPEDYFDAIEAECGDWDDVFIECDFQLTIPTYDVDSDYPPSDGSSGVPGGGLTTLVATDIRGSCCAADVCTGPRPLIEDQSGLSGDPQTPETCYGIATGTEVNVFIPGKTCFEQDVCDSFITNVTDEPGACCFGGAGAGACQDITFSACEASAGLSGLATGVFIPGERCSSLNGKCNLQSSPNSRQLGCCVKEKAVVDPFESWIVREYEPELSGYECFVAQKLPPTYRPYYIPGDISCTAAQSLNLTDLEADLFNGTEVQDYDVRACIPEIIGAASEVLPKDGTALRQVIMEWNTACRLQEEMDGTDFPNPLDAVWASGYVEYSKVFPDCEAITVGRSICCLRTSQDIVYSRVSIPPPFPDPNQFNMDEILSRNDGVIPVGDWAQFILLPGATRRTYALRDLDMVGLSGGDCTTCADTSSCLSACQVGACGGCTSTVLTTNGHMLTDYDVIRVRAKPYTIPTISYPLNDTFLPDATGDLIAQSYLPMHVILLPGITEMDGERMNLDRDCQVFFYPNLTLPEVARRSLVSRSDFQTREVWNPLPYIPRNPYNANAKIPGHPCNLIYQLALNATNGTAEKYLITKELRECMVSDVLTHALGYALFAKAGERIIHPHYFIDFSVQFHTWYNASRGAGAAFRHMNALMEAESLAIVNSSLPRTWEEYAATQNITDLLGLRVGHLVSVFTNYTLGLKRSGQSVPFFLLPWKLASATWNHLLTSNSTTTNSTTSNSTLNSTEIPPALSETGLQAWDDFINFNWITYENSTYNASGLAQIRTVISPMIAHPMALVDDGLLRRGMSGGQYIGKNAMITLNPRGSTGGDVCDPRDESCLKCRLIAETATVVVDHVLNCVEDYENTNRFNLNVTALDLIRNNTFEQPDDPKTCDDAYLSENITDHDPSGIGAWFVDLLGARPFLGQVVCYATNRNSSDPQSPLFWIEKLIFCDAAIDGSCHRGRAGIGLWPAVFWVTIVFAAILLVSVWFLPFVPAGILFSVFWVLSVLSVAYFWSPSCIIPSFPIPLPVLPDCLADDIFFTIKNVTEGECRDYNSLFGGDIFDGQDCSSTGRDFPQCAKDFGFDVVGFRHFFYVLDLIPKMTSFLENTDFVLISWIRQVDVTSKALNGISEIRGTPKGDFCFWANLPALLPISLTLVALLILVLILAAAIAIVLLLVVQLVTLVVHAITAFVDLIARVRVDRSRFYILQRS